jgi:hypothetical protein
MKSLELTKPITTESLLSEFESRFNQTMDLSRFTKEELEDTANHIRTKIHNITQNTHFGEELKDDNYQKNQMMLDIVNQAINEYGGNMTDPEAKAGSVALSAKDKLDKGQTLSQDEKKQVSKMLQREGVEEQSELILAAKDMMDKIQPAIEQAEATLTTTRQELDNGVRILTGEETASEPMGADDTMNMDTDLDSLDSGDGEESDEFGASDAEAGGTEPEGREQRESREVFEASNRIYGKLSGK